MRKEKKPVEMALKVSGGVAIVGCMVGIMCLDSDSALPIIVCLCCLFWAFMVLVMEWDKIVRIQWDEVDELLERGKK